MSEFIAINWDSYKRDEVCEIIRRFGCRRAGSRRRLRAACYTIPLPHRIETKETLYWANKVDTTLVGNVARVTLLPELYHLMQFDTRHVHLVEMESWQKLKCNPKKAAIDIEVP
ncbi:hypothetical protein JTB14_025159 [Gonioctena quinquepunctata]|nr:hypothetical protein JTB14_025159 [Gonioctena quinquepunctata]